MNREIKFRAWDNKNKKIRSWEELLNEQQEIGEGYEVELPLSIFNNKQCIFQQYTGLKDKNGVEIYEGDIVLLGAERWQVEYDDTCARFIVFNGLNSNRDLDFDFEHTFDNCPLIRIVEDEEFNPEVIGNIYENPELLPNN